MTSIWWRDIPVQVRATDPGDDGGEPVRAELPARFAHAVDRAAMGAGLAGTDAYLEQWDRRTRPCGPDLAAEVEAEVERLVAAHSRDVLSALVDNDARTPADDSSPTSETATTGATPVPSEPTDEVPT
nr:virulence factor [Salsipaludibacter albus]